MTFSEIQDENPSLYQHYRFLSAGGLCKAKITAALRPYSDGWGTPDPRKETWLPLRFMIPIT